MNNEHEIFRQVGYIQQTLSQDKKPIGVFIAAGCPLSVRVNEKCDCTDKKEYSDPLIPDVAGLTALIAKQLASADAGNPSTYEKLLTQMETDGIKDPNIEIILSQIRALKQVAGNGTVKEFTEKDLIELDELICKTISDVVDKLLPNIETPYHGLAAWAKALDRDKPVHIFTTNYDLLTEQALEEEGCLYFDGFIGARKAFFDLGAVEDEKILHPRWARLWKIHGSINWRLDSNKNIIRTYEKDGNQSYLIYPSHLKYDQSRKMPYLAMLDRLKDFIMSPSSALFIVGYSFSDDHINDIIKQSLRSNPTAIIYAFIYGDLEQDKYKEAIRCANATNNLSLIAFDKAIIGRKVGKWSLKDHEKVNEIPSEIVKFKKETVDVAGKATDIYTYELQLGDFKLFGNFLKEISATKKNEHEKSSE
jgi:hypothetical protein